MEGEKNRTLLSLSKEDATFFCGIFKEVISFLDGGGIAFLDFIVHSPFEGKLFIESSHVQKQETLTKFKFFYI